MSVIDVIRERLRMAMSHGMFISEEESIQIDCELDDIINRIKNCRSLEEAREKLSDLKHVSNMLAKVWFRYRIPISRKQREVVELFDWGYPGQDPDMLAFQTIKKKEWEEKR